MVGTYTYGFSITVIIAVHISSDNSMLYNNYINNVLVRCFNSICLFHSTHTASSEHPRNFLNTHTDLGRRLVKSVPLLSGDWLSLAVVTSRRSLIGSFVRAVSPRVLAVGLTPTISCSVSGDELLHLLPISNICLRASICRKYRESLRAR